MVFISPELLLRRHVLSLTISPVSYALMSLETGTSSFGFRANSVAFLFSVAPASLAVLSCSLSILQNVIVFLPVPVLIFFCPVLTASSMGGLPFLGQFIMTSSPDGSIFGALGLSALSVFSISFGIKAATLASILRLFSRYLLTGIPFSSARFLIRSQSFLRASTNSLTGRPA